MENHRKQELFGFAVSALEQEGWTVERINGSGKGSVRRITKGGFAMTASIRTTQDTWIAFPRDESDEAWKTLADVDWVVAATVDDKRNPRLKRIHMIEGDEMRARFDRNYAARKKAGHALKVGRGIWVSLYDEDSESPVTHVGAGAGRTHPPIAEAPLDPGTGEPQTLRPKGPDPDPPSGAAARAPMQSGLFVTRSQSCDSTSEEPLTIHEAKRRLAATLGVDPADITITISS